MAGDFAVIGLGRFGRAVAERLVRSRQAVLVVDQDPRKVEQLAPLVDAAICANATDAAQLEELRLARFATVVVAIGAESVESSILTTALLRQLGVPRIVARAVNDLHGRVLHAIGANEVVNPEAEMGERLAARLSHPNVLDQLAFDDNTTLAEMDVPASFHGKGLVELDVRKRHRVSVVAVRRGGAVLSSPRTGDVFQPGDSMLVIGSPDAVRKLGSVA